MRYKFTKKAGASQLSVTEFHPTLPIHWTNSAKTALRHPLLQSLTSRGLLFFDTIIGDFNNNR